MEHIEITKDGWRLFDAARDCARTLFSFTESVDYFEATLYALFLVWRGYDFKTVTMLVKQYPSDEVLALFKGVNMRAGKCQEILRSLYCSAKMISKEHYHNDYPLLLSLLVMDQSMSAGRSSELFVQPDELTHFISLLINHYEIKSVYNPFAGTASFARGLNEDVSYYGQEINPRIYLLARLRLDAKGRTNCSVDLTDSTVNWSKKHYDAIVANMPWGELVATNQNLRMEDFYFENASKHSTNRYSIGIYPMGVLSNIRSQETRGRLVNQSQIECVISLPKQLGVRGTRVSTCVVVTNNHPNRFGKIRFVDASECQPQELIDIVFSENDTTDARWVDAAEVRSKNYLLIPQMYLKKDIIAKEGYRVVELGAILSPVRGKKAMDDSLPFIGVKNLSDKPFDDKIDYLDIQTEFNPNYTYLNKDAILISRIGSPKATYYRQSGNGVYLNNNVLAFSKTTDLVTYDYLVNELWKPYLREQLIYSGVAQQVLLLPSLLSARIYIPVDKQHLDAALSESLRQSATETELQIQQAYKEYEQEIHTRRHALAQTVSAFSALYNPLVRFMQRNGGTISFDDIFGQPQPLTVLQALESLSSYLKTIDNQVLHFAEIDYNWGNEDEIELDEYLTEYVKNHASVQFHHKYDSKDFVLFGIYGDEGLEDAGETSPTWKIRIPKRALDHVIDNIVSNARSHGFKDKERKDYTIEYDFTYDLDKIVLEISNNGVSLKDGVDVKDVFMYGYSTALNESDTSSDTQRVHSGIGGYDIKNILKKYNAEVELVSMPDCEFSVMYRITFSNIVIPEGYGREDD